MQQKRHLPIKGCVLIVCSIGLSCLPAVYPDGGLIIHCTEVQDYLLPRPFCRYREAALVPHQIMEYRFSNAAQFALISEGDLNPAAEDLPAAAPLSGIPGTIVIKFHSYAAIRVLRIADGDSLSAGWLKSWLTILSFM